jgi:formylglycine-generating enzyme required for sulfatase activity
MKVSGWFLVSVWLGMLIAMPVWSADPAKRAVKELVGPIEPSIMVPPVRTHPPARTPQIVRPQQYDPQTTARKQTLTYRMESLRLAIEDLCRTFGDRYPGGPEYLQRWEALSKDIAQRSPNVLARFRRLRREAMLANPLLDFDQMLVLKRGKGQLGLPTNHQCNTALKRFKYDNELAIVSLQGEQVRTLYRPEYGNFVGEMDLHFDADRVLFTMPNGRTWQIHEIGLDGKGLRTVSREIEDVDNFDPCYLPSGRIVYSSTASFTGVPCWHGRERACCLFSMAADGSDVRQLCFDQDLDLHPSVLSNGQVIFSRWEYTGLLHAYVRPLMVMNPDGTGQRASYGSNSYYPNCLFYPRSVPGHPNKVAAILAGYHGHNRMGELAVVDLSQGWKGEHGILHRITHRDEPIVPVTLDRLTLQAAPQFLHPYPLNDKYLITAMQFKQKGSWGIYLVDVFDNVTPLLTDPKYDFFEPLPIKARPKPPVIPDRTDRSRDDAVVTLHDIYRGPGLEGVPRGSVKKLRIAAYHYGFPGMAGPDKVGRAGPWEVMRILGTVPVYEDGSAKFRIPANTPITLQALDAEDKAVQLMRTWYTAMPGETASCVGCHETPRDTPVVRRDLAASAAVSEIEPWYGPARGFDFAREVQPVLDRHCVQCHDGQPRRDGGPTIDLRDEHLVENYVGLPLTMLGATRIDKSLPQKFPERFQPCGGMPKPYGGLRTLYTPAYEALIPFIRRVNVEDAVGLLRPGEYHADTSELIQMLQKGHYGVQLTEEDWQRLVTWIDLNGPCHGSWGDVAEIPGRVDRRRQKLAREHGVQQVSPEKVPVVAGDAVEPADSPGRQTVSPEQRVVHVEKLLAELGQPRSDSFSPTRTTVRFGDDQQVELTWIPAGKFVMGDTDGSGANDEWPAAIVDIPTGFWISTREITNAQFRAFFPDHSSGVFTKRQIEFDGPGVQMDDPQQPAVRVTWQEAMEFCRKLSQATGRAVSLPTEAQWEYAARAGTHSALSFGSVDADFSNHANMADRSIACLYSGTAGVANLQPIPSVMQVDDLAIATTDTLYRPNDWGLFHVHGNAAEWTRSLMHPYPYDDHDGRNDVNAGPEEKRVVRGGSFYDRPHRCRSAYRLAYPAWQAIHHVGFRVVVEK